MSQPYTTRAQAAEPPAHLVETMVTAGYAHQRQGTSLPPWDQVEPKYQECRRSEMAEAIKAGVVAGLVEVRG